MGKGCVVLKSEKQQSSHCAQIGKSSAVTFNLLKDVQIVNGCYTAEMLLTDVAIVVNSNCLLRTRIGELHPYVPQWRKIVPTVIALISCFLSQKLLPAVFLVPTALPASLALSLSLSYCVLSAFLPPDELSFSCASLIYLFILLLLRWAQLLIRSIVFPSSEITVLISPSILHPSKNKRQIKHLIYLSFVCAHIVNSGPIKMTTQILFSWRTARTRIQYAHRHIQSALSKTEWQLLRICVWKHLQINTEAPSSKMA